MAAFGGTRWRLQILSVFGSPCPRNWSPFWIPFWHRNREKRCRTSKKHAQHSKQRKVQFPMPFFVAHFVAQTVHTICFKGFAHVHLNGFGVALGCHLGSLFNSFAIKCPNLDHRECPKSFRKNGPKNELQRASGLSVWISKKK